MVCVGAVDFRVEVQHPWVDADDGVFCEIWAVWELDAAFWNHALEYQTDAWVDSYALLDAGVEVQEVSGGRVADWQG